MKTTTSQAAIEAGRLRPLLLRLNVLHQIYSGSTEVTSTDETINKALKTFLDSVTIPYNNEDENHRNALTTLRDTLLADY
jgi:hypothetical protein